MVTPPASLNPPTDRRSISIDDYQPPTPASPQQSSSESDNDENDNPTLPRVPTRARRRRPPRRSNSSISLDSLDRDEVGDDSFPPNGPPSPSPPHPSQPLKRPRADFPDSAGTAQKEIQVVNKAAVAVLPQPTTPVSDDMEPDEPVTDDNLINVASLSSTDDFGWDRFIFFCYLTRRFDFAEDSYLSNFSPFSAVASSMIRLTARSVCAVCGAGGNLHSCVRCPLAFHRKCIDPFRTTSFSVTWMCPACRVVKNGDVGPQWLPEITKAPALPDPSTGLKRLIADARDGNPLDMVQSPSLISYYRSIAGADWLRCTQCKRIRIVKEGVLSEAVKIPFECRLAFWVDLTERRCDLPGEQRMPVRAEQRVAQYIRSRKTQRQLLFRFGFGEEDAVSHGRPDMDNLPVLRPIRPLQAQEKAPAISQKHVMGHKMQVVSNSSPIVPMQTVRSLESATQRRPAPPQTSGQQPQRAPVRKTVPTAAYRAKPLTPMSGTPSPSASQPMQQSRTAPPAQVNVPSPMEIVPSMPAPAAEPAVQVETKREPVESGHTAPPQDLLSFIAKLDWEEWMEDALTDLALANNEQLTQLYGALHATPSKFQRQAARLAKRLKGDMRPETESRPQSQPQPQPQLEVPARPQAQLQAQALSQARQQIPAELRATQQGSAVGLPQPVISQMASQQSMGQVGSQQAPTQRPAQSVHMQMQQAQRQLLQAVGVQTGGQQRLPAGVADALFRQMALKHVREVQKLEQHFIQRMEQVPATQVAEIMRMKDVAIANLKHRQQEEIRIFCRAHGVRQA